jgi:hypothetical protein
MSTAAQKWRVSRNYQARRTRKIEILLQKLADLQRSLPKYKSADDVKKAGRIAAEIRNLKQRILYMGGDPDGGRKMI